MAGLLDMLSSPAGIGLLSGVASYAANARRGTPVNNVGRGLAGGLVGYQQANDQTDAKATEKQQRELRDLQIQQARQSMEATTRGRQLAADAYKSATVPAKPGMPAAFNVGGQSFPDMGEAQRAAKSAFNVPTAALPGKPAGDMYSEAMGMPASLAPQPMGIAHLGDAPIQEQPAQEATPGGFDRRKYLDAVLAAGPDHPLYGEANKQLLDQQKPITLGKTLLDPDTYKVIATDEAWRDEQDATRQQRIEELNMRLEDRRIGREESAALRRELADQQAGLRRDLVSMRPAAQPMAPVAYVNEQGQTVWGTITEARGRPAANYDPTIQGRIASSKKEGAEIGEQRSMIVGKENAIESVKKARTYLNDGIYSGAWGPLTKDVVKRLPLTDKPKAARTEAFISEIGNVVIPRLKEFGGNDSNEEMKYLQRVMGGDITMEPEALQNVLNSAEVKIQRGIDRLNQDGRPRLGSDNNPSPPDKPRPAQSFSLPPNAKQYEGKTLRDTVSGKRYRAAGGKWQEVR